MRKTSLALVLLASLSSACTDEKKQYDKLCAIAGEVQADRSMDVEARVARLDQRAGSELRGQALTSAQSTTGSGTQPIMRYGIIRDGARDVAGQGWECTPMQLLFAEQERAMRERECDTGPDRGRDCYALGKEHEAGTFGEENLAAALAAFQKSCAARHAAGCASAAAAFEKGAGAAASNDRAHELYQKACKLGDRAACDDAKRLAPPE